MYDTEFDRRQTSPSSLGLLKLSRTPCSPLHRDHYPDMANYFGGILYECRLAEATEAYVPKETGE